VKLAHEIANMVEEIRALGPLQWGSHQLSVTCEQPADRGLPFAVHSAQEAA